VDVLLVPDYSGSTPYQANLARALSERGVGVTLAKLGQSKAAPSLIGAVRGRPRPDIVHMHFTHRFMSGGQGRVSWAKALRFIADLARLKLAGVRICWTVHDLISHGARTPDREYLVHEALAALCDVVFVQSKAAAALVTAHYGRRIPVAGKLVLIQRGNYIRDYPNTIGREAARAELGIDRDRFVLLFLGSVAPYKGVDLLLRTFRRLELERATLVIAGRMVVKLSPRNPEGRDIRIHPGFVPVERVQVYMNAADVVVLPYRDILASGSAVLAMSFGRAVIAPRITSLPELLDEHGAFLYEPDERGGLARAIRRAAQADLAAMGRHNFERALLLDWDSIADKTVAAYASLLRSPATRRLDPAGGYVRRIEF
jgi:glycosyltransferase involved in cell wall biosynthesis